MHILKILAAHQCPEAHELKSAVLGGPWAPPVGHGPLGHCLNNSLLSLTLERVVEQTWESQKSAFLVSVPGVSEAGVSYTKSDFEKHPMRKLQRIPISKIKQEENLLWGKMIY